MAGKQCDGCNKAYTGFGTTCSDCRKNKGATAAPSTSVGASAGDTGKCVACGKTAYAMERVQVEGAIFHPTCFKCSECNNKLSTGNFSKAEDGRYFCKVHYEQLFKLRGRYSLSGATMRSPEGFEIASEDAPAAEAEPEAAAGEEKKGRGFHKSATKELVAAVVDDEDAGHEVPPPEYEGDGGGGYKQEKPPWEGDEDEDPSAKIEKTPEDA